jgi:hypothetical protein
MIVIKREGGDEIVVMIEKKMMLKEKMMVKEEVAIVIKWR